MRPSRREVLAAALAAPAIPAPDPALLARHDASIEPLLRRQVTDPASPYSGSYADENGLHHAGSAGSVLNQFSAAFLNTGSRYRGEATLFERMRLAAAFLRRSQSPDGNISLLTTNFNSPPDTGFVVWGVAEAASIARRAGNRDLEALMEPFLRDAGRGMAKGGIHTPNHRWVVSSALAQIHTLYPSESYLRRIEQWLAEGPDIDSDGQWNERSTTSTTRSATARSRSSPQN